MTGLTGFDNADFDAMTGPELKAAFNAMVPIAVALGTNDRRCNKTVDRFQDNIKGRERCDIIRSEIKALRSGQAAADRQEDTAASLPPQPEEIMSEGRARYLSSGQADELREQVLADQQAALENVSAPVAKEPRKKEAKLAKTVREPKRAAAKAKKEKSNGAAAPRKSRWNEDATITKLVDSNPKREGTAAAAAFALYRTGMRVGTFIQKVIELGQDRGAALTHLNYDTGLKAGGKQYIKIA